MDEEWDAYLTAYRRHLDLLEESLSRGRVLPYTFDQPQPSRNMPKDFKEPARELADRTERLALEMKQRMQAVGTVLRYSRMKDPSRIVLIDVKI